MNQKTFKIAEISANGKNAYTATGLRAFLPERLRGKVKAGDYMIVMEKTFTQATVDGEIKEVAPWTRLDVTFAGTKEACLEASSEDAILAIEAKAFVANQLTKVSTQYNLTMEALNAVL